MVTRPPGIAWRLAATNTHLYPGARMAARDGLDSPRRGDAVVIEFADQSVATGAVVASEPNRVAIEVGPYRTARGTAIAQKVWTLGRAAAGAATWRVTAKGHAGSVPGETSHRCP